ncbi:tape measure domain-containing protein [Massilia sp. MP_M2]|uniref:tape measure protein n=1 Tax=Massilia sp. MP_M2 TaxID=3071713 RepID=UPI00319E2985
MSTITNEAIIKVTTDATGVEEGGRRIDASTARTGKNLDNLAATAKRTGKSLDDLSSSSGMRAVGDGAGTAAGKVDRATLTMAASIQRATAAADAGAKSGADFYASLANSRGLNMTALRPYLDQLDAVTRKTAQAAAAQRQLDAGNSFLDGLRSQADGIGKTASQLAALRAEQLGVADDARPLIEQLQAAEEAAGNAGSSISGFGAALASVAFGGGIAAVAQLSDQYGKYLAQLKLATTGQSEFTNAQNSVRRIATSAQSDLSSTASLYASITKSTRDLGIAQAQVASITESVSLALKVSGASTGEASSAILQLSQAFASGVLRGDEFNSVNEASPRLMQALADGIGVPVGALRAMAEQGKLTTEVLANALPRALGALRNEARSVETIGGAVTVLKNNVMEMVGATAQSSGVVTVLSGSINLLADNLTLAAGAMGTVVAVKLGTALHASAAGAVASMMANRALALSNLASAQSNVAATAAASATAAARVNELRAAVLAAQGNVALAITNNGLIPAQARATAAASAHAAALTAQATAARAASVSGGLAGAALTALGGPVGAVIAVLGIAATAWAVFGNKAEQANDQATQSTEESTGEMIVRLDEQIKKLRERNALAETEPRIKALDGISEVDKDGLARAKAALDKNRAAQQGADARTSMMLQLEQIELSNNYNIALKRVEEQQGEVAKAALRTRGERLDEWYAKNGSGAQRLAAELAELKKQFGTIPPEMEKLVRAKYADPASAKTIKDQAAAAKEYADLVDRINGKSAGVDPDYQENLLKLSAGYGAGKQSLEAYRATVEAYIAQQPFAKQAEEERLRALKEVSDFQDSYSKGLEATSSVYAKRAQDAEAEAVRNEELASTYGLTKSAIEALELARLQDQLAQRSTLGLTLDEIESLENLISAKQRSAGAVSKMEGMDAAKKAGEELDRLLDPTKAQSFGDALKGAFGAAGDSMTQLVSAVDAYGIRQAEVDKARQLAAVAYAKDSKGFAAATAAINEDEVKSRLSGYGDMATAAKGFFSEGSKGYALLSGAEKAFRAFELASQMESLYTHLFVTSAKAVGTTAGQAVETTAVVAGEAARNVAKVPGVYMSFMGALGPWGMAAAGVAIAAVLGGSFSGGSSVPLSQQRQEKQGTGTVLGDSSAKSESIANSIDAIEGATLQGLRISDGMLASLRNIEAGIGQFASFLVQSTGVAGDYGKQFASADGNFLSKIGSSIFGGKKTVEDTGFLLTKASFESILNGGTDAAQYADIKKSGGLFSSGSTSSKIEGLGAEGNRQIAGVLTSLYQTVIEASSLIGIGGDDFTAKLSSFVVDIGKVSLKGLTGAEIQEELSAVFSKVGDDLAAFGVDGLGQFQKVGEGYLETLSRVATNYQAVTVVTDSLGMVFDSVGLKSVGARERLVGLAGGLEEFTSSVDQFLADFYTDKERADSLRARITPTLDQYGIQTGAEDSLKQFRSVVTGLDLTTDAGARAYAALMQIAPAFKQIADVDKDVLEKATDLSNSNRELEIQIMEMLGDKAGALAATRALELGEMDASLRPLRERVYALEDEAAALGTANSLLSIQAQIYELTGDKAGAAAVLSQQHVNALAAMDPALRGATQNLWDLQAAAKATEAAAAAAAKASDRVKSDAAGLMSGVDGAYSALQRVVERQKKAMQEEISVRTASVQKIESLSQALRGSLDSMSVTGFEVQDRQAAQAQIQTALAIAKASGVLPSADDLKSALSVLGKDSSGQFSTQEDYLRDFYATRIGIEDLAGITDKSLSAEERSLKALEDQVTQYDQMLEREQEQIDVLKGISTIGLSIEQAIQALRGAMGAAGANPYNSATSQISDAYKSSLGRAPDAAGLSYWQDRAAGGISTEAIIGSIKGSPEAQIQALYKDVFGRPADSAGLSYWIDRLKGGISLGSIRDTFEESAEKKLRGFAVGTNYAPADMPAQIHEGERIIPAADNRELMRRLASPGENSAVLVAAVERLTEENRGMRKDLNDALYAIAKNTMNTASSLDDALNGDKPLATKVIA